MMRSHVALMPIDAAAGLAPARAAEVAARRALADEDHEEAHDREHAEHDEEPVAVAVRDVGSARR